MRLYDHPASANCMKARMALRALELPYEPVTIDLFRRETRTPEHLARNPDGRVPVLELDSGETIPESGAILLYLAEGTPLLPGDRLARARVHQWLFFEQNQIEAQLAVARFLVLTGRAERHPDFTAALVARGRGSLKSLERGLADGRAFVTGETFTVADIALYAYVHCAGDAGVDPREHAAIAAWLDRVEATERFVNDLEPLPEHARVDA
ncbi:MAG: glutathione S-transferase [Solirubrobacteraceae bacterium]|nr:glutathione S-transferase [Solirubrobacteraceae bacterium]